MKSPKLVLLAGAALLTATVVVAQLTPEQRKAAEEALQKKMQELDAREGSRSGGKPQIVIKDSKTGTASKGLTPEQEAKAREALAKSYPGGGKGLTPEQEAKARAALNQAYAGSTLSPEREAKARAALNQAYAKADKSLSPEQEAKARAALTQAYAKADRTLSPEQEAMAREALLAKNAELNKRDQLAGKAPAGTVMGADGSPIASTGKYQKPEDITISQEQWNQLVDLTEAYKTDKIGAAEYHAKRSEVIGAGGAQ